MSYHPLDQIHARIRKNPIQNSRNTSLPLPSLDLVSTDKAWPRDTIIINNSPAPSRITDSMSELPACYGSEKESLVELGALILGNRAAVSRPRDTATVWPSYALLLPLPGLSLSLSLSPPFPPSFYLPPLWLVPPRRPSLRVMHTPPMPFPPFGRSPPLAVRGEPCTKRSR